jgi:peptidoglycan/xylan/chitin deacetylase (PgdA/CDA1 family)
MKLKSIILKLIDMLGIYPLFNKFTRNTATIFMLHRFAPSGVELPDCTSADMLDRYLGYLKTNNYSVLSLSAYVDALINGKSTYKAVVFTVDDGYRDFYDHAFPVFSRFGHPAAIFLTSDFIEGKLFFWWDTIEYVFNHTPAREIDLPFLGPGKFQLDGPRQKAEIVSRVTNYCKMLKNEDKLTLIRDLGQSLSVPIPSSPPDEYAPLNWNQILEMQARGIEFFPHTVTHPILSRVPVELQRDEVSRSRAVLESHLGAKCDVFCYPNGGPGDFTVDTITALRSAGYSSAVTGIPGFDHTTARTDLFRIKRFSIPSNEIFFKQYVCGLENFKSRLGLR